MLFEISKERQEADKLIEKLKQQHEAEISSLQLSLNRMIAVRVFKFLRFMFLRIIAYV